MQTEIVKALVAEKEALVARLAEKSTLLERLAAVASLLELYGENGTIESPPPTKKKTKDPVVEEVPKTQYDERGRRTGPWRRAPEQEGRKRTRAWGPRTKVTEKVATDLFHAASPGLTERLLIERAQEANVPTGRTPLEVSVMHSLRGMISAKMVKVTRGTTGTEKFKLNTRGRIYVRDWMRRRGLPGPAPEPGGGS